MGHQVPGKTSNVLAFEQATVSPTTVSTRMATENGQVQSL